MAALLNTSRVSQLWLAALWLLATFAAFTTVICYSTAKAESMPVVEAPASPKNLLVLKPPASATTVTFAPFIDVVPLEDGTGLSISAGGVGQLGGTAFINVGEGPGHNKGHTPMVYSDTLQSYIATVTGFTPHTGASGPLNITTTLGLDTGVVSFNRAYIPASTSQIINSMDGILQLSVVSTDTLPAAAYVAVMPSFAPPGPAPSGHRFVGSSYSVRTSGAIIVANRPMSLRLAYDTTTLAGADPHTLAIFAWDAFNKRWDNLGGTLFSTQQFLSVATSRFTTYALMATPTWRDEFDESSGLDFSQFNNVTLGGTPQERTLILANTPGSGSAVSQPITPATTLANWDKLIFSHNATPPTTGLTIDILSAHGSLLLANVASGTSLASSIDPAQYPSLRLRLNLSSTSAGATPALKRWEVSWQVKENKLYLPVVMKE